MQLSLPTKKQLIRGAELVFVTFFAAASWAWLHTTNPFSKDAIFAAGAAGVAAVYTLVKSLTTTL